MKTMALLGGIGAAIVSVALGEAEPLKYLGREGEVPTGWIEFGHEKYYEIGAGTEIPSWGHVVEVRDDRIVVEQVRTEAEKRGMEERGALVQTCSRSISCAKICGSGHCRNYLSGN